MLQDRGNEDSLDHNLKSCIVGELDLGNVSDAESGDDFKLVQKVPDLFLLAWLFLKRIQVLSHSPGSVFTTHSHEHSLSFSPRFCKSECNTTSDWLNRMV